jgi:hypothetical protein
MLWRIYTCSVELSAEHTRVVLDKQQQQQLKEGGKEEVKKGGAATAVVVAPLVLGLSLADVNFLLQNESTHAVDLMTTLQRPRRSERAMGGGAGVWSLVTEEEEELEDESEADEHKEWESTLSTTFDLLASSSSSSSWCDTVVRLATWCTTGERDSAALRLIVRRLVETRAVASLHLASIQSGREMALHSVNRLLLLSSSSSNTSPQLLRKKYLSRDSADLSEVDIRLMAAWLRSQAGGGGASLSNLTSAKKIWSS